MKEFEIITSFDKPLLIRLITKRKLYYIKNEGLLCREMNLFDFRYKVVITPNKKYINRKNVIIVSEEAYNYLDENDIILVSKDKLVVLWKHFGNDNSFFLTDACSSYCIMCPQPPKEHKKELENLNFNLLKLISKSYTNDICLTGGEPTLYKDYYLLLLSKIRKKFPYNFIITLSNGKSFSDIKFINDFMKLNSHSLVAISFPSDLESDFDEIMGVKNSFIKTHNGIYNLAKANQPIELRIVISKYNYKRLSYITDYIYKNYPFVVHIVFIGIEYTGLAAKNYSSIYINPVEYSDILYESVIKLYRYGMNVSVYNIPLCLLDERIHRFSKQSISQWKQTYDEKCIKCVKRDICCGIFTTSTTYKYNNINYYIDKNDN